MADVTDPRVIRFVNESIRPLCEKVRNLKAAGDITLLKWTSEISDLVPNDPEARIQDGRDGEGISHLSGADINAVMSIFQSLLGALQSDPSIPAIVNKPCVRELNIG